ncbi:type IV secretion system protein [Xenorhabdus sp. KK7.4]|uniref:type IV secretion system protein n=1 Tax=Xenorhabdus sp. KK7.4 TaxID=1851572 RepID=UPI000C048C55|nr:type IV secretion system protein [Xenorhabdus sp. KK7.4]PHM51284.1 type IV secretion system protein VirB5 [Xenorhabdus sp. KK7.4]
MKIKKLAIILSLSVAISPIYSIAGIPVSVVADATATINQVQNMIKYVEQIEQLKMQLTEMGKQYEQQIKQFESLNGRRRLAGIINSQYNVDSLKNLNVNSILRNSGLKSSDDYKLSRDVGRLYDISGNNAATYSAQASRSLNEAQSRFKEISGLVSQVNLVKDPKSALDLNARIGAEQAFLQNEVAKLQILQQKAQSEDALFQQQIKQMAIESGGALRSVNW